MVDICNRLLENWTFQAKFEIEIQVPEVSHRKNSFFLLFFFFFFAELVLVTLTLSLYQFSNVKRPQGCCGKTSYLSFYSLSSEVVL